MHDISNAEEIKDDNGTLIGYVKPVTDELWLPVDTNKMTISGPTYKGDAENIVHINSVTPIQPQE